MASAMTGAPAAPPTSRARGSVGPGPLRFLMLPAGFLVVCFAVPFCLVLSASLSSSFPGPATSTLAHYGRFIGDAFFRSYLWNTLIFGSSVTMGCLVIGYPLAYYMVRHAGRYYRVLVLAVVSPLLIGVIVRTVGWAILLGAEGLVNGFLRGLGLTSQPIQLLYNPVAAAVGLIHVLLPFMVLSVASVLSLIDRSLEEAAQSLGANDSRVFWRVTFPLSLPGVSAGTGIVFSLAIGAYVTPYILGGGRVRLLSPLIFEYIIRLLQWPFGAAMAVILLLTGLLALATLPVLPGLVGRWRR